ncbi:MAG: GYF domain-containing protein [Pirellulales bacterium]
MGIVAYCPNGHRVKVKDELAGRKGVCPECQARFRIPHGDAAGAGGAERRAAGYPVARVVSLDPAVAAGLPRAVAVGPVAAAPGGVQVEQPAPPGADAAARQGGQQAARTSLHPTLAERPELTWSVAVPGGEASAPMSAEAMQSVLDAGGLTGAELVWREGWADWVSIRLVFPECLPAGG